MLILNTDTLQTIKKHAKICVFGEAKSKGVRACPTRHTGVVWCHTHINE